MNEPIFGAHAAAYFARGISVIPLQPFNNPSVKSPGKQPIPVGWSAFAKEAVPDNTQAYWIANHPDANIGLVTGPQSNIIFIDVDSVDQKVADAVGAALQIRSPWIRIGQKGFVAAYRYMPYMKNFRIKDMDGNSLVECLALGCQAVIPPSIHPKTKKAYTANVDLLSVIDFLPVPPEDLEHKIRENIQKAGIELSHTGMSNLSDFVARGARDNQMTYVAGLFAHYVTKGERTLQEAFGQMEKWFETSCQRVDGDDISLDKGMKKILEFLSRDVIQRKKPLPLGWDKGLLAETKTQCDQIFLPEHIEWSAQALKEYAHKQFTEHPDPEDPARMEALHYMLERLARSPSLNNLDQEAIIAYLVQTCRIPGMTVPNIRKRIKQLRQGEIQGTSHMEIATAVLERMNEFGEVRQHNGIFHQWKGAEWKPLDDSEILKTIAEQFDGFEITKRYSDHVGILKVLRSVVPHSLAPMNLRGVNFANGFLHFEGEGGDPKHMTLTLKPHLPDFGATYTLGYRYMPDSSSQCPNFLKLLHDCWGEDDDYEAKVMALQDMIATSLFQYGPIMQRCTLLYGVANSGKSTILKIIRGLFPDDCVSVIPPDVWEDKFAPTMMAGKLINVCNELSDKKILEGKSFKEIIDGDERHGQFKMQQLFKFCPVATHWFGSNHLPKTLDTSDGFNRRWLILWFRKSIELINKVLGLHNNIIAQEREAIAAWAIEAFLDTVESKTPTIPESHEHLIEHMANQNNSVRFFLNESRRVLTRKRLKNRLAAMAREAAKLQAQREAEEALHIVPSLDAGVLAAKVIPMMSGAQVAMMQTKSSASSPIGAPPPEPGKEKTFESMEQFDAYATATPISEDALYGEYLLFCGKQAGVKGVGTKTFRDRLRELESSHDFKLKIHMENDGFEKFTFVGIVVIYSLGTK